MTSALALGPSVTSFIAGLARSADRHARTTCAPASASILAVCRPMPVLAPVTIATLPLRSSLQPSLMPIVVGYARGEA